MLPTVLLFFLVLQVSLSKITTNDGMAPNLLIIRILKLCQALVIPIYLRITSMATGVVSLLTWNVEI